jgi:tetratricopeptide (TPR) repeat protein
MRAALTHACRFIVLLAMLVAAALPAVAGEAEDRAELDRLFAQLRVAPDPVTADGLADRIWRIWSTPSDPELAARMTEAMASHASRGLTPALALLDALVADYPDYAEGWNQRATLRYLNGDYDGSLADIDRVLALEPRHFGALAGRVLILLARGDRAGALRDMATALGIHPFLNERRLFPELEDNTVRI